MHEIWLDNYLINYQVFFKNNKHLYLRVRNQVIEVRCSRRHSIESIEQFILAHKDWIIKNLNQEKYELYHKNHMFLWGEKMLIEVDEDLKCPFYYEKSKFKIQSFNQKMIEDFYHQETMIMIDKIIEDNREKLIKYFNLNNLSFKTQLMKSRLGSCHLSKKVIKINTLLARVEARFLKLVLFHELSHLKHQNHSKSFHNLLESLYPNHRIEHRELTKLIRKFHQADATMKT
jgi:hypothetical protein